MSLIKKIKNYGLKKSISFAINELNKFFLNRLLLKSYSQNKEDLILENLLNKNHNKGFYIDIGAHDPIIDNNTFKFYKKGWKGILIEPIYSKYSKIKQKRPRDIILNIGVGNKNSLSKFYEFEISTLSTFDKQTAKLYEKNGYKIKSIKQIKISKLSDILDLNRRKFKNIDILDIDVEGLELNILKSNNWKKYKPTIILIESERFIESKDDEYFNIIYKYMISKGYVLKYFNGLNSIYVVN